MSGQIPTDNLSVDRNTPDWIVESVKSIFQGEIHLDPCSNNTSIVKAKIEYKLPQTDGLKANWEYPTIYVNPPYGTCYITEDMKCLTPNEYKVLPPEQQAKCRKDTIEDWIKKAVEARDKGSSVIMLIPAYMNNEYYHEHVLDKAEMIYFPRGRVKFQGEKSNAAFHVNLVLYSKSAVHQQLFEDVFKVAGGSIFGKA